MKERKGEEENSPNKEMKRKEERKLDRQTDRQTEKYIVVKERVYQHNCRHTVSGDRDKSLVRAMKI
jgi:hypothetical protein